MIPILIVTHGILGKAILEVAQEIIGAQEGVSALSIFPRDSLQVVQEQVSNFLNGIDKTAPVLIFTDMVGGTPCNVVLPLLRERGNLTVIAGINLNMLLTAFVYRQNLGLPELETRIIEEGKKAVVNVGIVFQQRIGKSPMGKCDDNS